VSVLTVTTSFNIDLDFRIAPFHKRLLAWMIDLVLIYIYVILINRFVVRPLNMYEYAGNTATILFLLIPAYSYHLLMEVFCNGQSVGKMAMGIQVMDLNGHEATLSQYLLRWLFRLFDMMITLGAAAVLSTALTKYSQRLGDIVAGTVVIDKKARTDIGDTIYLDLNQDNYKVAFPQIMQLNDRDINGIRNLLDTKSSSRDTEIYMEQVAQKIKDVLKIQTEMETREFLKQLLHDYNFLTRK
jgi:uncharacterized RDD family membrane protein YckC